LRAVAAEFLGTFALVFFGCGAIANGLHIAAPILGAVGGALAYHAIRGSR
jgi:glycerol uptake facilitator-like aquaporin